MRKRHFMGKSAALLMSVAMVLGMAGCSGKQSQWTFAPCIGNPQNIRWGRTYEGFSEKAEDIGSLAASYIKGFQDNGVIACAKHFIGEGYTADGVNQGNVAMSVEEFDALLQSGILDPYKQAVDAGVLTVMASYNSVNAGVDLLMEPKNWKTCYEELLVLANNGDITEERLNDAVSRNLRVKFAAGLFEEKIGDEQADLDAFGSEAHREVAREAVRKSLVLLKNNKLGDKTAIEALEGIDALAVAGQKAFDLGSQCGGCYCGRTTC